MTDTIVAATGHRLNKLLQHIPQIDVDLEERMFMLARDHLIELRPSEVISGMALGWDTAVALAALDLGIPLTCACPFEGQERLWSARQQMRYRDILSKAARVVYVCRHKLNIAFQERNEWMVDRASHILALWDGTPGGTANCIEYAERWCSRVENLWQEWIERND